jgi:hypothetical protein
MVEQKYTPILKWKSAEKGAISDLTNIQKDAIIPLFEFIQPTYVSKKAQGIGITTPEEQLLQLEAETTPQDLLLTWGDGRLFYSDFSLIIDESIRLEFGKRFLYNCEKLKLETAPVLNLTADGEKYQNKIIGITKNNNKKICIRINWAELLDPIHVKEQIQNIIIKNQLNYSNMAILIDLKDDVSNVRTAFTKFQTILNACNFSDIIIASGAFPKDMTEYKIDQPDNHKNREDWSNWMLLRDSNYTKTPRFADYTIRHPIYDESIMKYRSTATIKYTLPDRWNIYKGQVGVYSDYLANANIIRTLKDFYGPTFSAGDAFIDKKGLFYIDYTRSVAESPSKKSSGTGNTEQWIRAGINHHIATVIDQISNLPD